MFENPNDYSHVFCAEESIAWKLVAAIFDAKVSFQNVENVVADESESCYGSNPTTLDDERASFTPTNGQK